MSNPNLALILRRVYALAAASMLPAGGLLLAAGRRGWAIGLLCGVLVSACNAGMLVWRMERAAERPERARRIMQQGMSLRFALVLLATVVALHLDPGSVPGLVLGLLCMLGLEVAVAARALLLAAAEPAPLAAEERRDPAAKAGSAADTVTALVDLAHARRGEALVPDIVGAKRSFIP